MAARRSPTRKPDETETAPAADTPVTDAPVEVAVVEADQADESFMGHAVAYANGARAAVDVMVAEIEKAAERRDAAFQFAPPADKPSATLMVQRVHAALADVKAAAAKVAAVAADLASL